MGDSLFPVSTVRAINAVNDTPELVAFWNAFPKERRTGKDAVRVALRKALKRATIDEILHGLSRTRWPSNPQYIPHPTRWLNEGRWQDEHEDYDPVAKVLGL